MKSNLISFRKSNPEAIKILFFWYFGKNKMEKKNEYI